MDSDSSGESSESAVLEAPETGRLRRMLRSHWPIRCLAPLVLTSLLLGGLFFCSRRAKPLPGEVVGQPTSLYSAQCLACGRSEVLQCIVRSGGRHPSEQHAKRPQRPHAQETFRCNDGCTIWQSNVNDDACHCSDCEDEEAWSCRTCGVAHLRSLGEGETVHIASKHEAKHYARDVGVGVGVGLSSAFALGFGLAFGLDAPQSAASTTSPVSLPAPGQPGIAPGDFAIGIYYVVVVNIGMNVFNAVPFRQSSLLKQVVRRTVARIGRVSPSMAALRFPDWAVDDDDDDDDDDGRRLLRKPGESVDLDVGIRCDSTATASEVERRIRNQTAFSAQQVMNSELQTSGATGKVEIVRWQPAPNPLSFNPNKGPVQSGFVFQENVSLGLAPRP